MKIVSRACDDCGVVRHYDKYEVTRGRVSPLCQPCAVKAYNTTRPKRPKEEKAAYQREYYKKRKQHLDSKSKNWRILERLKLISQLGGCCAGCSIRDPVLLDFDHIQHDGAKDRSRSNKSSIFWVKEEPSRFQLLCKNCNWLKEYNRRKEDAVKISAAA